MDKTPVQKFMNDLLNKVEIHSGCKVVRLSDIQNIFDNTAPTERQFAETCFEAGKNSVSHVVCVNHRGDEYGEETEKQSFSQFYKQYTHD